MSVTTLKRATCLDAIVSCVAVLHSCDFFDPYAAARLDPPPPLACRFSRGEIIRPENWRMLQDYLNDQASMGVSGTPAADTTTINGLAGAGKWRGDVVVPNGKIYGIPINSTSVLIIDTKSNGAFCESVVQSAYFNKF